MSDVWKVGNVTLTPGKMAFRPNRLDHPFTRGETVTIDVSEVDPEPRKREGRGKWRISGNEYRPEFICFRLRGRSAQFELALPQHNPAVALQCLSGSPSENNAPGDLQYVPIECWPGWPWKRIATLGIRRPALRRELVASGGALCLIGVGFQEVAGSPEDVLAARGAALLGIGLAVASTSLILRRRPDTSVWFVATGGWIRRLLVASVAVVLALVILGGLSTLVTGT